MDLDYKTTDHSSGRDTETGLDIKRLLEAVVSKAWLIALVAVLCAVLAFLMTLYMIQPKYQSSAMFYVNNSSVSVGDASFSISSADITAAKSLVESYIVILNTRESLNDVIDYAGVSRTYGELKGMISAASVNDTEIFRVVVTSTDPAEAEKIADAIAYILPKRISSIIEGTSAKVVDAAVLPTSPSSPNYTLNTLIGFLLGAAMTALLIIGRELFDVSIRAEEDITGVCRHPVLAAVPDMHATGKAGLYEKSSARHKNSSGGRGGEAAMVGGTISFGASEAYKLLRTKLQYSFAGDNRSRVIGVSSALTGEGKSLSAINLAYTLSQLNKRVLLIDCDMRRPSVSLKLPVNKRPGLSGYLSGQIEAEAMIQACGIKNEEDAFDVIAAGRNPPNPMELLSSERMNQLLEQLKQSYDYIILDLPPVGEVSDALAVAKETDGVLLVVRQNYCDRISMTAAIRQFEFVGARILGIVYNGVTESTGKYGKAYYRRNRTKSARRYAGAYLGDSGSPTKKNDESEG